MEPTCGGFVECTRIGDTYTCQVGDSNYLFRNCSMVVVKAIIQPDTSDLFTDVHFVYEVIGGEVPCQNLNVPFTFNGFGFDVKRYGVEQIPSREKFNEFWFKCSIPRPIILPIDEENPDANVKKIKLVFRSKYDLQRVSFFVERSWIGNYYRPFVENSKPEVSLYRRFWNWLGY